MATMRSAAPEDDFLPPGYEPPQTGGKYLNPSKLPVGQTRVRVLAKPLLGSQGWVKTEEKKRTVSIPLSAEFTEPVEDVTHMWWLPVYHYQSASVMVAQIKQSTIQGKIDSLSKSTDWGSPFSYDILIVAKGSGFNDREYDVLPTPKAPLSSQVHDAWQKVQAAGFNMARIFSGGDPFGENGNGNGPTDFDPAAADPSTARKRFFSVLGGAVKAQLYGPSIKADSDDGRLERRKLLKALLGGEPDPATLSFTGWDMAATKLSEVIAKNVPPAGVDPDADIPF